MLGHYEAKRRRFQKHDYPGLQCNTTQQTPLTSRARGQIDRTGGGNGARCGRTGRRASDQGGQDGGRTGPGTDGGQDGENVLSCDDKFTLGRGTRGRLWGGTRDQTVKPGPWHPGGNTIPPGWVRDANERTSCHRHHIMRGSVSVPVFCAM